RSVPDRRAVRIPHRGRRWRRCADPSRPRPPRAAANRGADVARGVPIPHERRVSGSPLDARRARVNDMAPRVTAILVTYRSAADVGAALDALKPAHAAGAIDVIVVDNRSTDDTVAIVRRDHPWATLVESPVNLGYGRGLNVGLSRAATEYVLFMNPDAVIAPA